ncbi:MAG: hypothetical protein A2589_03300 [Candidatus Vogelbacteria bacterium RIFOXYD1_FULL_46_19]|uniref:ABC3 transporter permease C-terminal domain-containing protein n=1 Tax=Candidatus Vogelbacteria bacterium RIFOXYD1_FULL_46_19 TaxID=1802439 RepID=A0A1G2QGX1_9BACT|nr:MAG: hypothetical protein A2589_03300 [Candidatus Vogelbacteria bacterium RIFOXYD1_FULL_46_19]
MLGNTLRVGLLLGWRQIRYASLWTTALIIFVMMLTFMNLVVVTGILVGLIEGSVKAYRDQYTGDIFISTPAGEEYIKNTNEIISVLPSLPGIAAYTVRSTTGVTVEANYRTRRDPLELRDSVGTRVTSIDPIAEDIVTGLSGFVVEGEYLEPGREGEILIGANLLDQYAPDFGEGFDTLDDVHPGTRVRLSAGGKTKEYIVRGVVNSKVDETSRRIFMVESDFLRFIGRTNLNVNEIAIRVQPAVDPQMVKANLVASGLGRQAVIRLSREGLPQALEDIIATFAFLGNLISSIGLVVASITIFIVVFVNAITRRKYIGILKGIGISPLAIELSYVFQSVVYAVIGSAIAVVIIYGALVPWFLAHPLDFPFSDGILVAPVGGTVIRLVILMFSTIIAGYVPAWLIIKKNTLDSILGR